MCVLVQTMLAMALVLSTYALQGLDLRPDPELTVLDDKDAVGYALAEEIGMLIRHHQVTVHPKRCERCSCGRVVGVVDARPTVLSRLLSCFRSRLYGFCHDKMHLK